MLRLEANGITDAGAAALAEGLRINRGLLTLDLRQNFVGRAGAAALAVALVENTVLREVKLEHNYVFPGLGMVGEGEAAIAAEVLDEIASLLARNAQLAGEERRRGLATASRVGVGPYGQAVP